MKPAVKWFDSMGWKVFQFQKESWEAYHEGYHGIVNAPTGSGKTYSLLLPILLNENEGGVKRTGLKAIWITPIRALTKEIHMSAQRAVDGLGMEWTIGVRTGDTTTAERSRLKNNPPDLLITTPESLHLLLAQKGYETYFRNLDAIVVDEWHELMGSKRGVQIELALSRLKAFLPKLRIWGISATIGNMDQALEVLLGTNTERSKIIKADIEKKIEVLSILPDEVET
ncbi:MAG: DEAD/DEAH box helicase, partial [Chitinophagales bacterium]|nr:DEAD/DEAH box helicase [Chitinophagales bacterium]